MTPAESPAAVELLGRVWDGSELAFLLIRLNDWVEPVRDKAKIAVLERLRRGGARFLVVGWPAFWWLDHYRGFHRHLRATYRCAVENDRIVAFDSGDVPGQGPPDGERARWVRGDVGSTASRAGDPGRGGER